MRKHQILMIILGIVFFQTISLAQTNPFISRQIDSLLNILEKQKDDTNKVNILNKLSNLYLLNNDTSLSRKNAEGALLLSQKINYKKGSIISYLSLADAQLRSRNYFKRLETLRNAVEFAELINDKKAMADFRKEIGLTYYIQRKYEEAIKNYTIAGELSNEIGYWTKATTSYYAIGQIYYVLTNFTEGIKAYKIAIKFSNEIGDSYKYMTVFYYSEIGKGYEALGNYSEAVVNYLAGIKISEKLGDLPQTARANVNIGGIYKELGKYEDALKYYRNGLKMYEEYKNTSGKLGSNEPYGKDGISTCYNGIGQVLELMGNYTDAMNNYKASLNISKEAYNPYNSANSYHFIGNIHFTQLNYSEALSNYSLSLELFKKIKQRNNIAQVNRDMGEVNFRINNFPDARQHLNEAVTVAKEVHFKKVIQESYNILSKIDSAIGDWTNAYKNQKLFALYRDSVLNEQNSKKTLESMMEYEFEKKEDSLKYQQALTNEKLKQQELIANQQKQSLLLKEKEVVLLNNEKLLLNKENQLQELQMQNNESELAIQKIEGEKKQDQLNLLNTEKEIQALQIKKQKQFRNYLLIGVGLLTTIAAFGYYNYRTSQQLKLQKIRNKIASDLHDDVGSTLSSISIFSQLAQQQSKEVIPLLETIGDNSRKMLDAMGDIVWSINPENDQFEKIILRMRSFAYELLGAKKIDFEFNADEEVAKMKLSMEVRKNLYLIFKEATNNLVKYSGANKATFNIKTEKDNLTMLISDNGKGFNLQQTTEGNGLKNMKKRAEEIRAQFMILSTPGNGTTLELKIAV